MSVISRWGMGIAVLAAGLGAAALLPSLPGHLPSDTGRYQPAAPEAATGSADRAVAFGYLIDSARPQEVIDEGLVIADKLRRRYDIDTGHPWADRAVAAQRANAELLGALSFDSADVERMALSLGYSLDAALCADFCDNVRRLAIIELQKQALREFAEGTGPARAISPPRPE